MNENEQRNLMIISAVYKPLTGMIPRKGAYSKHAGGE